MGPDIPHEIDVEIRSLFGGRWPRGKSEYLRAAHRFGCSVAFFPRSLGAVRSCFDIEEHVIYVPELGPRENPGRSHRHELAEACAVWEGREPCVIPQKPRPRTRHDYARCVDLLEPKRPFLTVNIEAQIDQHAAAIAELLTAAGFETLYISVRPGLRYPETVYGRRQ